MRKPRVPAECDADSGQHLLDKYNLYEEWYEFEERKHKKQQF